MTHILLNIMFLLIQGTWNTKHTTVFEVS